MSTPTNAQIIANALHRAASASTEPIKAEELLHPRAAVTRKFLGARLCGLTLHWLNKEQKFSMAYLAKACGMNESTAASRIGARGRRSLTVCRRRGSGVRKWNCKSSE